MPRLPRIPLELRREPFSLDDAAAAGLTPRQLQGAAWERWGPRTYAAAAARPTPEARLLSVLHRLPPGAVFSGPTAAWIHGLDFPPCSPIEVTVPQATGVWARAGIAVRRAVLTPGETTVRDRLPVTSAVRTAADLGRRPPFTEAVVALDQLLHAGLVTEAAIAGWAARHRGHRGVARLLQAVELADVAAESPMETRLRLLLVRAGLPRPQTQAIIVDANGRHVARVDLYYPSHRLAIEYDGDIHRQRLAEDMQRQNRLLATGVNLLRFTAPDVLGNPHGVAAAVRAYLAHPREQALAP